MGSLLDAGLLIFPVNVNCSGAVRLPDSNELNHWIVILVNVARMLKTAGNHIDVLVLDSYQVCTSYADLHDLVAVPLPKSVPNAGHIICTSNAATGVTRMRHPGLRHNATRAISKPDYSDVVPCCKHITSPS